MRGDADAKRRAKRKSMDIRCRAHAISVRTAAPPPPLPPPGRSTRPRCCCTTCTSPATPSTRPAPRAAPLSTACAGTAPAARYNGTGGTSFRAPHPFGWVCAKDGVCSNSFSPRTPLPVCLSFSLFAFSLNFSFGSWPTFQDYDVCGDCSAARSTTCPHSHPLTPYHVSAFE
jgi:hypothetical protein